MAVRLDDGRSVAFNVKDYNHIDHGYAATIHKSQGVTIDRAHVLATPGMDQHSAYVALSRHREGAQLHFGQDDFADDDRLARTLSRERGKDMASDYEQRTDPARSFAERRGITFRERVAGIVRKVLPDRVRDLFDGLREERAERVLAVIEQDKECRMTKFLIPLASMTALAVASVAGAQTTAETKVGHGAEVSVMAKAQRESGEKGIGADVSAMAKARNEARAAARETTDGKTEPAVAEADTADNEADATNGRDHASDKSAAALAAEVAAGGKANAEVRNGTGAVAELRAARSAAEGVRANGSDARGSAVDARLTASAARSSAAEVRASATEARSNAAAVRDAATAIKDAVRAARPGRGG